MGIADRVKDWGGFEQLVATLNETGEVTVQHNTIITGRSGAPRQIDVVIKHKQGLYEHLVVAECKYWNSPIERLHVDSLATTVREVGASRGVIFSTKGFQSGAVTQAAHENIDLFLVRDLTPEEWGLPGRVVDIYLQVMQPSIGNIVAPDSWAYNVVEGAAPSKLDLQFGPEGPVSATPLLVPNKTNTLEQRLDDAAQQAMVQLTSTAFTINGGEKCTRYMTGHVHLNPETPFVIRSGQMIVTIPSMQFELGIKVDQSRITVDRAENYLFALAVENCVTGVCSSASRTPDASYTTVAEIAKSTNATEEGAITNGSVLRVYLKAFFPFEEMRGLQPIELKL